ncbi:MAG TPA: hypothetical protein VGQ19_01940 [Burkholderiales bacterium]|nr:hypothetical protein [Burkholderiales bacterium]
MRTVRGREHGRSRRDAVLGLVMVHVGGCQQAKAGVVTPRSVRS